MRPTNAAACIPLPRTRILVNVCVTKNQSDEPVPTSQEILELPYAAHVAVRSRLSHGFCSLGATLDDAHQVTP